MRVLVFGKHGPGELNVPDPPPPEWRVPVKSSRAYAVDRWGFQDPTDIAFTFEVRTYQLERWSVPVDQANPDWEYDPAIRRDGFGREWHTFKVYRPVD